MCEGDGGAVLAAHLPHGGPVPGARGRHRRRAGQHIRGHGKRSRLQLLFKLGGTVSAALTVWLSNFGCTSVYKSVLGTLWCISECFMYFSEHFLVQEPALRASSGRLARGAAGLGFDDTLTFEVRRAGSSKPVWPCTPLYITP